jgi:hypothetical protein
MVLMQTDTVMVKVNLGLLEHLLKAAFTRKK